MQQITLEKGGVNRGELLNLLYLPDIESEAWISEIDDTLTSE